MRKTIFSEKHRILVSRIRKARKAAGLTQIQAAKRMRKPQSFVSRLESGQRRIDVVEINYLAELYGCKAGDILTDADSKFD